MLHFLSLATCAICIAAPYQPPSEIGEPPAAVIEAPRLRANYIVTVADDFVVEIYHNGKQVPDSKRVLYNERFGAISERDNEEVHSGDWLVFHVVSNRLRWGGAYYFAAAGCFAPGEFGFVSSLTDKAWSYCDSTRDVQRFISDKSFMSKHAVKSVTRPWAEGLEHITSIAGGAWNGNPIWGDSRSTWIKVVVE